MRYQVYLLVFARELWWINQECLELRWGSTTDQKWLQCKGRFLLYNRTTVTSI
jgi:hypothetical protein